MEVDGHGKTDIQAARQTVRYTIYRVVKQRLDTWTHGYTWVYAMRLSLQHNRKYRRQTRASTHAGICLSIHRHTHVLIQTHTHTHTQTYAHTHTHTHTSAHSLQNTFYMLLNQLFIFQLSSGVASLQKVPGLSPDGVPWLPNYKIPFTVLSSNKLLSILIRRPAYCCRCRRLDKSKSPTVHVLLFQDLQSEIEAHQHVFESLNTTGQQIIRGVDEQQAAGLQMRLEEMNQRWVKLKTKSVEIR